MASALHTIASTNAANLTTFASTTPVISAANRIFDYWPTFTAPTTATPVPSLQNSSLAAQNATITEPASWLYSTDAYNWAWIINIYSILSFIMLIGMLVHGEIDWRLNPRARHSEQLNLQRSASDSSEEYQLVDWVEAVGFDPRNAAHQWIEAVSELSAESRRQQSESTVEQQEAVVVGRRMERAGMF